MKTSLFNYSGVLLLLIWIFIIQSCSQSKEVRTISMSIENLSTKYNCELGFLDQRIDQKSELIIKLKCSSKSEFFPGKILLDSYSLLNKKGVKRDYCSIVDLNNKSLAKIRWKDAIDIINKKRTFEKHFKLLIQGNREGIINSLHKSVCEKLVGQVWFDQMFVNIKSRKTGWEYEGLTLKKQDSETYLLFGEKLQNEVIIWMSYRFSKDDKPVFDDRIYGIGVLPLR